MKRQTGIWIDSSKAIIVSLEGTKESITEINSDVENKTHHNRESNNGTFSGEHHSSNETQFENRKAHQMDYFLNAVVKHLKNADELYIIGPAETKTILKKKILADSTMSSSLLKAVESAEKMTANQLMAQVKEFYME